MHSALQKLFLFLFLAIKTTTSFDKFQLFDSSAGYESISSQINTFSCDFARQEETTKKKICRSTSTSPNNVIIWKCETELSLNNLYAYNKELNNYKYLT